MAQGIINYDAATTNDLLRTINESKLNFPFDSVPNDGSKKGITSGAVAEALKNVSSKMKGYFLTEESLKSVYTTTDEGSKAYVGENYPYAIYLYESSKGGWYDTKQTGGDDAFNAGEFYTINQIDSKVKELEEKIGSQTVEVDTELNEESQKPIANAPVTKAINEVKEQISTQFPAIEEAKENAIAEIGNKESDAIQNFSEQRVTPGMLSPETIQIINASGGGTINNLPDGETLAEIEMAEGLKAIGIPNRQPDTNLGYVILKKNKSLIEQITDANTIYEVRYAYDLGGETLAMPENCVLKFEGGIIGNGRIVGNSTKIISSPTKIFDNIIFNSEDEDGKESFSSLFIIDGIPVEWFGAESKTFDPHNSATWIVEMNGNNRLDDIPDSSDAINSALKLSQVSGGKAYLCGGLYRIDNTISIPNNSILYISNTSAIAAVMNGTGVMNGESEKRYSLKYNEYFPSESMAKAIIINGYNSRIEGHGQLLLQGSNYTIGVYIPGKYYNAIDMTLHPYVDIRVIGGLRNQTCPEPEDIVGEGTPSNELDGTYYFDKTNKIIYKKSGNSWSNWKNAWCFYNTSLRIDVTQTDSDYRIVNADINIWDIYGFRGIEIIQAGSSWCNDCFWHGSVSNKCSNYVSVFGTNIAQHDMTAMNYQCGAENSENSMICYCQAHGIYLGRAWDLSQTNRGTYLRYVMSASSYGNTAQWVSDSKYVEDYGNDNNIYAYNYDKDLPNNACSFQYIDLYNGNSPVKSRQFLKLNVFKEYKENDDDYSSAFSQDKGESFSIGMFNDDPQSYSTMIDTDNNIYASAFMLWYEISQFNGILTRSNHCMLLIEYEINDLLSDNDNMYVKLFYGNKQEYYYRLTSESININSTSVNVYRRTKIYITDIFKGSAGNGNIARYNILFFTKSSEAGQKLNVYRIRLLVDGGTSQDSSVKANMYGLLSQKPDCTIPGHIYYSTDYYNLLANMGSKDAVSYESIKSVKVISHEDNDISLYNLIPGVLHTWGNINSLKINSLAKVSNANVDEYIIQFTTTSDFSSLTLPSGIKWIGDSSIEPNNTYQIRIINGFAKK